MPAPGVPKQAALDVREATYYRRSTLSPGTAPCNASSAVSCVNAAGPVTIEMRWYAHRALPSVLVLEVSVAPDDSAAPTGVEPYALLHLANTGGAPSKDISFTPASGVPPGAPYNASVGETIGTECPPGACGNVVTAVFGVALLNTHLPAGGLIIASAAPLVSTAFLGVVRTSIETPPGNGSSSAALLAAAQADYAAACALAAAGTLHSSHVDEWAETLWTSGFSTDRADVAAAVNSSLYSLLSSLRPDRPFSTSPGGLANNAYNGAVCVRAFVRVCVGQ